MVDEVLFVHRVLIARFGGSHGIRDRGAPESALARPQTGYYRDLIEESAALWESLSQNHPFIDGNKRAAVTVMGAFLKVNGYRLEFTDEAAFDFPICLYEPTECDSNNSMRGSANTSFRNNGALQNRFTSIPAIK
jgi:death-on-curing protein